MPFPPLLDKVVNRNIICTSLQNYCIRDALFDYCSANLYVQLLNQRYRSYNKLCDERRYQGYKRGNASIRNDDAILKYERGNFSQSRTHGTFYF